MKKLLHFAIVLLATVAVSVPVLTTSASAADPSCVNQSATSCCPVSTPTNSSADAIPEHEDCAIKSNRCSTATNCELVKVYIQPFVDFLAAFVGVAVVISMIYGGIEYSSSGGDPQKAAGGKKRIFNGIVALLVFLFFWALLRFALLPGALD